MVCRIGERPPVPLGDDGFKAPELFDPTGAPVADRAATGAEDVYAFGAVIRSLLPVLDEDAPWLSRLADDCAHPDAAVRPRTGDLFRRLSLDLELQEKVIREAGW